MIPMHSQPSHHQAESRIPIIQIWAISPRIILVHKGLITQMLFGWNNFSRHKIPPRVKPGTRKGRSNSHSHCPLRITRASNLGKSQIPWMAQDKSRLLVGNQIALLIMVVRAWINLIWLRILLMVLPTPQHSNMACQGLIAATLTTLKMLTFQTIQLRI